MLLVTVILLAISTTVLTSHDVQPRQSCGQMYEICDPQGATSSELPSVGIKLGNLYSDLVQIVSIDTLKNFKLLPDGRALDERRDMDMFCCAQTSQCLLLPSYGIPFCWDRFTTDYYFPDKSYGSLVTGNYTSALGVQVNLIYGNWTSPDGVTGNIYSNAPGIMPNTSTMPMPTPWTSAGVGSAISASNLGSSLIMNETVTDNPSTTISAITLVSTTITIGMSECRHCNFTIIPGLTGLPPTNTAATTGTSSVTTTNNTGSMGESGLPSVSNSIYTPTTMFPPINRATSIIMLSCQTSLVILIEILAYLFLSM